LCASHRGQVLKFWLSSLKNSLPDPFESIRSLLPDALDGPDYIAFK
jgi:hypothetical protein